MITLYTFRTPNGRKPAIFLEELGLDYSIQMIDINKREQFAPEFLAISPNNKIPALVDSDGPDGKPISVFESGAILIYLAEKTESPLWPKAGHERYAVLQWLMFQMGGVGPMFGQTHHFVRTAKEHVPYAVDRFMTETRRLYGVMNEQLAKHIHLAGPDYSIADIATYPWVARHEWHKVLLEDFPNVKRWFDMLSERPTVQRGMAI